MWKYLHKDTGDVVWILAPSEGLSMVYLSKHYDSRFYNLQR